MSLHNMHFSANASFSLHWRHKKSHQGVGQLLSDDTCLTALYPCIGLTHRVWWWEASMLIIYSTTVLTESDRDRIVWSRFTTLTWEDESLSCDRHLMDQSLWLKRIDNTIESREIHATVSLSDEFFFEVGEGDTWTLSKYFDKSFSLFGDARFRHKGRVKRKNYIRNIEYIEELFKCKYLQEIIYTYPIQSRWDQFENQVNDIQGVFLLFRDLRLGRLDCHRQGEMFHNVSQFQSGFSDLFAF